MEISHFKLNFTYFVSVLLLGLKSKPNNFLSYEYFQCHFCLMFHNTYTKLTSLITSKLAQLTHMNLLRIVVSNNTTD